MMKTTKIAFLLGILLCSFSISLFAQQDQRIRAAYMLAYGRSATGAEVTYWLGRGNLTIAQLVAFHRDYLKLDSANHIKVIEQSYLDALGRYPSDGEKKYYMQYNQTYTEIMENHIKFLKQNPAEYDKVINNSYGQVARPKEMNFWRGKEVHPYYLIMAYHHTYWDRKQEEPFANAPGVINLQNSSSVTALCRMAQLDVLMPTA